MELGNQGKKQKILIPAEAIANNIDLLTEILLKLQVKPLVRFKSVSKQWLSLISESHFCLSHTRHHHTPYPTPTALLLRDFFTPNSQIEILPLKHHITPMVPFFDYLNNHPVRLLLRIRQSCNGLLLYSFPLFWMTHKPMCKYYICNPTAKKFKPLSFPSLDFHESLISVCVAFDPLKSNYYNLICIRTVVDEETYQIDKYSSETDCWSLLGITFFASDDMDFVSAVFCNGAVHWYSKGKNSLYFDVDRECLNTMPMPKLARCMVKYFGESQGHLHLIVTGYVSSLEFDVLEMAADYSGWFVRYHVNLDALRIALPEIIWHREGLYRVSVLHVFRAQKEEESVLVLFVDNKTISFNVHNGISRKILDFEHPVKLDYTWRDTHQYFEILTSV